MLAAKASMLFNTSSFGVNDDLLRLFCFGG
jgi:hypothetical protein